mmetsp:Transcript_126096/g.199959  ORF Transcript_126096/g.199959 Transcript_126096/m.199959 type:complete len:362 (-) Transcript_126096:17-1102(-)
MMSGDRDPEMSSDGFEDVDNDEYMPTSSQRRPTTQRSFDLTYDKEAEQICETGVPDSIRQTIFEHPKVTEAVRNSEKGRTAPLSDPAVQEQMLSVCYERHPEVAEVAPAAIALWGKDPAAQRAAQVAAGHSPVHPAIATLVSSDGNNRQMVNQASPAIRAAAFGGGIACIFVSLFPLVNPVLMFTHPVVWSIHAYQLLFSVATLIFEAKPSWVTWVKNVENHKEVLLLNAQLLASALGRGLFYIFQGVMWLCMGYAFPGHDRHEEKSAVAKAYMFIATFSGIFMVLLGVAHLLMHWEILPEDYATSLSRCFQTLSERIQGLMQSFRRRGRRGSARTDAVRASDPQVELSSRRNQRDEVESF